VESCPSYLGEGPGLQVRPHPGTISALLRYFRTGAVPRGVRVPDLLVERPNILRFGARVLVIDEDNVERGRNWLFPLIEDACITFRVVDNPARAQDILLSPEGPMPYALGAVTYTFTSALSLQDNLIEFIRFLANMESVRSTSAPS